MLERAVADQARAFARLAGRVRGGGKVDEHARSRFRLQRRHPSRRPDILADADPDRPGAKAVHGGEPAGPEVAFLVEDPVVRQGALPIDMPDCPFMKEQGRVVEVVALSEGRTNNQSLRRVAGGQPQNCRLHIFEETMVVEQILGRIAGQREFRERDEIGGRRREGRDSLVDRPEICIEIPDRGIDLRESQSKRHAPPFVES